MGTSTRRKTTEAITPKTCTTCGACCIAPGTQDVFCDISQTDAERLGKKFVRLHVLQPSAFDVLAHKIDGRSLPFGVIYTEVKKQRQGPFRTWSFTVCRMLRGSVFHSTRCSIYNKRPDTCKTAVVPGDKQCRRIRKALQDYLKERSS